MRLLYQELGLDDKQLRKVVLKTATSILMARHVEEYKPEMPLAERKKLASEFEQGIKLLQENDIIRYSVKPYMGNHSFYSVAVTNGYKLQQLISELNWLEYHPESMHKDIAEEIAPISDTALYERDTGRIIINGKRNTLKNTNKKLFDALFVANPSSAKRNELLKIVGSKNREQSSKIALNEAFSNLRKACGVTSRTISLGNEGGKLNAFAAQLVDEEEMYFSNFHTD
jgi:hypothetical protein